ncbi:diguanylate cyclase (GGDEF) domain-containing protein [Anaerovirgula multivorans]|uniref:Diguanylate cyclase (GGDEF) domain-containing protein n=1 Tax=Anaerovirgula multivorans TaxID=312168 RepID=A0A239AV64_9FIRM|nr:GGDEF domain-containing protein [Anaerovirgula multivorans]SNR99507.1 diguanylate cyclase (GGDEF) domain-containing protein [Anaerovirgula multivorans]
MKKAFNLLISFFIPFGLLFFAYIIYLNIEMLPPLWIESLRYAPHTLFLISMLLGSWFNKSKVLFIAFTLAVAYWSYSYVPLSMTSLYYPNDAFQFLVTLGIPINLLLFSFLRERGILSLWGKLKVLMIMVQGWSITYLINRKPNYVEDYFKKSLLIQLPVGFDWDVDKMMLLFIITAIALFIKAILKDDFMDKAFLSILTAMLVVIYSVKVEIGYAIFFSAAGLMLIVAIIQSSYKMAYIDELTQIPSRRALEEELLKLGGQYTIAMIDIDFFKKFNDRYGHDIGDDVLRMVAACLKRVGGSGKAFRYGGEEFTIVFHNRGMEEVTSYLEELRKRVSQKTYDYKGKKKAGSRKKSKPQSKKLHVTISIGIAEKNEIYSIPEEVRKSADKALYRAKKKGRNCVCK